MAKSNLRNLSLTSVDDLFETDESRKELNREKVIEIPLTEIDDFPDHPFKVRIDAAMQEMVESIKNRGVLTPAIVRKKEDGRYELISGHRRKKACELADIDKLPVLVKEMSNDEATIFMVDSNLQRDIILPSEKAFSYKMRLEAMKRQGERSDLTSTPVGEKLQGKLSVDIVGEKSGDSREQVRRYIRLTELIPEVLQMTDEKRIAFQPAVMISYLPKEQQQMLHKTMDTEDCTPSLAQTQRMKKLSDDGRLNEDVIFTILTEEKPNQKEKLTLNDERFDKYFPKSYTTQQKEELLAKLLESWWQKQRQQQER